MTRATYFWLTALWLGNRRHSRNAGEMAGLLMRIYRANPGDAACS